MGDLDRWVSSAVAAYAAGCPLALLFDYDGTLTPIVAQPRLAELSVCMRTLLHDLALTCRVTVGVLSGRALADVKRLTGLTCLLYAGSGGMHVDLGGEVVTDAAAIRFDGEADAVMALISPWVRRFRNAWVERKPGCLALHYRQLSARYGKALCRLVRSALARAPDARPGSGRVA
ncbi:MAG TPA: trehalose-phosphatase [Gemmataceae bacterium]|jgi:trehalose 6-phosphate phosphatase